MYTSIQNYSHYSLLRGLSKPSRLALKAKELGLYAITLTDSGNLSGCVDFIRTCEKNNIKWIMGNEFQTEQGKIIILAKNHRGWLDLMQATNASNQSKNYNKGGNNSPQLDLEELLLFDKGDWLCITGYPGSTLCHNIFEKEHNLSLEELRKKWSKTSEIVGLNHLQKLRECFGDPYLFLGLQANDLKGCPIQKVMCSTSIFFAKQFGFNVKLIPLTNSYYLNETDAIDQRILLCQDLNIKLADLGKALEDNVELKQFIKSDNYFVPTTDQLKENFKDIFDVEVLIKNSQVLADECEKYSIFGKPMLPHFDCPNSKSNDEYMKELCEQGFKRLNIDNPKYRQRYNHEVAVLEEFGLAGYFLIVTDYVKWAQEQGCYTNLRGSGAGSLVCYLLGISNIDPIKYNLLFERFINKGRLSKDHISYPDLDMDFPILFKEKIIEYIENKYGPENVSQMITFHRMQGRGALKDVLKARGAASFQEINKITEHIPNEAAIADQLQTMKEETGDASIIRWALENESEKLKEYCYIDEEGKYQGPYAQFFEQAIRMEGTKIIKSKHAAGLIISKNKLTDVCPMIYDEKSKKLVAGIEMEGLEAMGHIKFDILSVATLDKMMLTKNMIKENLCSNG